MKYDFYPNVEYNRKRRNKYFALFLVLAVLIIAMDAWFVSIKMWAGLAVNALLVLIIALTPKALSENPVNPAKALVSVGEGELIVNKQKVPLCDVQRAKATVYLGSVGNLVENRDFIEKCAASHPPENALGMIEFSVRGGKTMYAVIDNVVEALTLFVAAGKCEYSLGYSLGKDYRASTYNLKTLLPKPEAEIKSKTKQLL